MLDKQLIIKARKLHADGQSIRQISSLLGIGRASVARIIENKNAPLRKGRFDINKVCELETPCRCSVCGSLIAFLPCVACNTNRFRKLVGKTKTDSYNPPFFEFGIDLTGNFGARYEKLKRWRDKQENPFFVDIPNNWPWRNKRNDKKVM